VIVEPLGCIWAGMVLGYVLGPTADILFRAHDFTVFL
jgi:hypothetical protein